MAIYCYYVDGVIRGVRRRWRWRCGGGAAVGPVPSGVAGRRLTVPCGHAVDLSRESTELSDLHLDSAPGGAGRDSRFTLLHVN